MDPGPRRTFGMANSFDPYREALVVEVATIWPDEFDGLSEDERDAIAVKLHAQPREAVNMDYQRMHTGFCREITVTPADVERVS